MEVPSDNSFIQISAGQKQRICGILSKGDVKCWGSSRRDKSCESKEGKKIFLLFWSHECAETYFICVGPFLQVSTGTKGTCALNSNHTVDCWNQQRRMIPSNSTKTFQHISLGVNHACALSSHHLECWHNGPNLGAHEIPLGLSVALNWS